MEILVPILVVVLIITWHQSNKLMNIKGGLSLLLVNLAR